MGSVKWCTYRCNFLFLIILVFVSLFVLISLYHPKINQLQLPNSVVGNYYFKYYLQDTPLIRQSNRLLLDHDYSYNYSTYCSSAADRRGPHQKVISYSLYGDFSKADAFDKYLSPLKRTINLIPSIYPGNIYSRLCRYIKTLEFIHNIF